MVGVRPSAGAPVGTEAREVELVQCWSRTSAAAVHVGEPFSLVLTCAVVETPSLKVLVDETKLDPSAAQFPPFEVLGGRHAPELRNGDRRFFQYVYDVRLIDDTLFGTIATLPAISLSYRVQTGAEQGKLSEGIERTYVAPAQSVRVLSLVSDDATDIRDAEATTFDDLAVAAVQASGLVTAGGVLIGLAGLLTVVAVARAATHARATDPAGERHVQNRIVLRGIGRDLTAVRRERDQTGWTPSLAERVLASLRIAGRFLLSQPLTYRPEEPDVASAEGTLSLSGGAGRLPIVVWGSTTTEAIARALVQRRSARSRLPFARHQRLQQLHDSMVCLTRVHYGRDEQLPETALDAALVSGQELVAYLRHEQAWFVKAIASVTDTSALRRRLWSR